MNKLVAINTKPVVVKSGADRRRELDDIVDRIVSLGERYSDLRKALGAIRREQPRQALPLAEKAIAAFDMYGPPTRSLDLCRAYLDRTTENERIYDDDARYQGIVSVHLAALIGSYPNAKPGDPDTFARTMLDDVVAEGPSLIGLELACRRLRRAHKFIPSISEVLSSVEEVRAELADGLAALYCLESDREELTELRDELAAKVALEVAQAAERKAAHEQAQAKLLGRFPKGCEVYCSQYGFGSVEGATADRLMIRFLSLSNPSSRMVLASEAFRVLPVDRSGWEPGRRVVHSKFGFGTIQPFEDVHSVLFDTAGRKQIASPAAYCRFPADEAPATEEAE